MIERLIPLRGLVRERKPLIHCLTNPISINDCANVILAVGAKPIMAEHPKEVKDITAGADALLLNLGNITDNRMTAMCLSAGVAKEKGIPIVLDLVGVACSGLRLEFAQKLIRKHCPEIIRGNRAELAALKEGRTTARGVDARESDLTADLDEWMREARVLAGRWSGVLVASGPADIVATADSAVACRNGHSMMGDVTGTGCMQGALMATFSSVGPPQDGALLGVLIEAIAGETAALMAKGIGDFHSKLIDEIYNMKDEILVSRSNVER